MAAKNGTLARLACFFSLLFILLFSPRLYPAACSSSQNQAYEYYWQLENGLKVYFWQTSRYALSTAVLAVKAGSCLESAETSGLTHLLEHSLLFRQKPTNEKSLWQKFKEHGLYLNAHTELESIFFETLFPAELLGTVLNLLSQVVFDFKISEEDLEKEKEVVLKELKEIARDPIKVGMSTIYSLAFPATPYGQPVFGRPEAVKAVSLSALKAHHDRYFKPGQAALVIIGPLDLEKVQKTVKEIFSSLPGNFSDNTALVPSLDSEQSVLVKESRQTELTMNISETYLMAGFLAPAYKTPEHPLMDVLVEILGYGVHPLLYSVFSGYPDLVSSVRVNYFAHSQAGLLLITTITKKEKASIVKRLMRNF
ncbi:MAG: insulinase family protein, partial [Candidatus Aminicenantes bacterium]|nr:insulinase family protein [Candidatus Aminicenantes bacterium]